MSKWLCECFRKKPPAVDYWDCSRLRLEKLPVEVVNHRKTLTSLNMSVNNMRDVPKEIFSFVNLTELDVSENDILFLPPAISRLTHLTSLNLGKNSIQNVPNEIQYCHELVFLDLSTNPLGSLCDGITDLRQLRTLILNDCQIEELPPNLGKLSKVEVLELRENLLQSLPQSMCHMTLLEKLDLGCNEFHILSSVVGTLESLSELWLDTNMLNTLPDEIGNLRNLRFLEASENHLMALPVTINGLSSLTDFYLHENLLSMLPDTIGELSNVGILRLDSNRLTTLPDTIGRMTSLMELNIVHNHLMELPSTIGGLVKLINLSLDENLLSTLPQEIGGCVSLSVLSLRNNQLIELPAELSNLQKLSILNVVGNRLYHLPYSLTELTHLSAIWIAENQSRPIVELQLEVDKRGEKWLTCFLLPQQGHEPPYDQASSPLDSTIDEEESEEMLHKPHSTVAFDPKVQEKKSKITRDLTPYPKELHTKAMQWRATRGELTATEGHRGVEVSLRSPIRRFIHRPFSLLKALSDPLDEENLQPSSSHRVLSVNSRNTSPNPSTPPVSPTSPKVIINTGTSKKDVLFQLGREPESTPSPPPLPPPVDSNTSILEESNLDPYLEPPAEFSEPPSSTVYQNGSFLSPHEQIHGVREPSLPVSIDNDQMVLLPNSNVNNNNSNGVCLVRVRYTTRGGTNTVVDARVPPQLKLQGTTSYNPSQTSTLSHSDARYSSMESGFDADTEQENSVWYLSPDSSPKHPKQLGPTVIPPPQTRANYRTGSQSRTSSAGDDYDHLPLDKSKMASSPPGVGHQSRLGHHQPSQSFDACDILSTKPRPQHKAVFGASTAPQCSQVPLCTQPSRTRTVPSQQPQQRGTQSSGHTRSISQPEELRSLVAQRGGVTDGNPLRNYRVATVTQQHPHPVFSSSYGCRIEREQGSSHPRRRPEHVMSDEALQRVSMQAHMGGSAPGKPFGGHRGERARHKSLPPEKLRTQHHQENYYISDESQTSGGTPTLPQKAAGWVNSHDSGFDSMKRSNYPLSTIAASVSGRDSPVTHAGLEVEVELEKAPTLGLGITGGINGENAIKPGDPGFHVYKIMEGLPAHKCGKIARGDKLLEINRKDLSGLTTQDVLELLMGPEKRVSLLLFREPSVTLL